MAYRVLNEVGGRSRIQLTKQGKAMLIDSILNRHKKELKFLGKSDENIEIGMQAITELKKHNITVEDLQQQIGKIEDKYLKTKLKDITLIYEKFQEQIEGKYIEEADLLTILTEQIEKTDLVKDAILYFDEFAGFTKQEYEVIKKLIKLAKQVNITICTDDLNFNTNPDQDIYYSNKTMITKLWNIANENDFEIEQPVHLTKQYRFKTEELHYLSEHMNQTKSTKYEKNVENIALFLAQNPYSEIENIAQKIAQFIKEKKKRYKDIAIITKNIEDYASLVRAIFPKYKIPVFIDEKRDVNQNIIIQYSLALLEILQKNFATDAIFHYLKLGFFEIDSDEIFELENYCNKWGIKQNKWKRDFPYEMENEERRQKIERFNELRKRIIEPLLELKEKIYQDRKVENITKNLYLFWQEQHLQEKISQKIQELEEESLMDLANEYIASYKILIEVLEEIRYFGTVS